MQKSFLKGVTPALAVILLASVTVGVVSTAYYGISSTTKEAANVSGKQIEQQFEIAGSDLKLDNLGNCKIYLRNTGTKDVPIEVISFYVAEPGTETYEPVTTHPTTGTIKKEAVQEINFTGLSTGEHKLLIKIYGNTMDYGYMTCTGPECTALGDCDGLDKCSGINFLDYKCDLAINQCESRSYDCSGTGDSAPAHNNLSVLCNCDCEDYDVNESGFCTDGKDNDCDGYTDDDDSDCVSTAPPAAFSCSIKTGSCGSETEVLALSAQNNSHAETNTAGNYDYKLCCSNISSVQTTTGTGDCKTTVGPSFTGLVTLSGDTNAQVEKYNYTGTDDFPYKKNVCVELTSGSLDCVFATSCSGEEVKVISISSDTNAHIGNNTAYSDLVLCCEK